MHTHIKVILIYDAFPSTELRHKCINRCLLITSHNSFWGSRQQMLSGKVIADWIDRKNGPLDPIFGVLLQPTTGRAGPADAGLFNQIVFDNNTSPLAYHSAVQDAFGYLKTDHNVGPGSDYMYNSEVMGTSPLAEQTGGGLFCKKVMKDWSKDKHIVMEMAAGSLAIDPTLSNIIFRMDNPLSFDII